MSIYLGTNKIAGGCYLYSSTGNNTDGAMTQNACTVNFVNKAGDTMTGDLTIDANQAEIYLKDERFDFTDRPASNQNNYVHFQDKNGLIVSCVQARTQTNYNDIWLRVRPIGDTTTAVGSLPGIRLSSDSSGNVTFTFPRCTTAATTTSSASSGKVAVVVENYVNGTSWYRVWSDGWIEQGGQVSAVAYDSNTKNLTYLKAFSNTNYTFTACTQSQNHLIDGASWANKTKTQITVRCGFQSGNNTNAPVDWYACGY